MSESIRTIPPFVRQDDFVESRRTAARPTTREWVRHAALFLLTALTAAIAGIIFAVEASAPKDFQAPALAAPVMPLGYVLALPVYYLQYVGGAIAYAFAHPAFLAQGATFAGALLAILLAHESGHYVACRLYGVDATLPFFIPAPPPFPAGTFGAFIKIKSAIPSRRALFDIGVAGPLAGFLVTIPIAIAGVMLAQPHPMPLPPEGVIYFNDSLLMQLLAALFGVDLTNAAPNPLYFAAWIGLLVTSLNLLPVGQLDGGHATYSLFGAHMHRLLGRAVFATIAALAFIGLFWHGTPSGFIYALILFIMLRVRHPQADDEFTPLGRARTLVAALTLAIFLLSFVPFPVTIK